MKVQQDKQKFEYDNDFSSSFYIRGDEVNVKCLVFDDGLINLENFGGLL